jgi:hypothetical protein
MLLQWRAKQLSQASSLAKFAYINTKQSTLKCSFFYVMTEYNAFIHYNIENNIWEEEVPAAKNRVKQLHKAHEKLLKQWESTVASQVKAYNQRHKPKTYNKSNLVLLSMKTWVRNAWIRNSHISLLNHFTYKILLRSKCIAYIYLLTTEFIMFSCLIPWTLQLTSKWWDNAGVTPSKLINEKEEYEVEEILESNAEKVSCDIRLNE